MQDDDPQFGSAAPHALLVDDDPSSMAALSRVLRDADISVVEMSKATDALRVFLDEDFDVIVSDVQMPDMSGVELLRAVRKSDPDISFLLISGAPDVSSALEAVQLGATEYLTKPIAPENLLYSTLKAVSLSRKHREQRAALQAVKAREARPVSSKPAPGSWTGAVLSGRYRIGEQIGSGGMGNVYAATREDLGDMSVAVKILHQVPGREEELFRRFRREAEIIARLNHPNIVRVFDFVAPADGPAYLVMERLEGRSLATVIAKESPLQEARAVFIATQILSALTATHKKRIVHRDLKPENVFLTSISGVSDVVRVLDFGVAKAVGIHEALHLTHHGALVGTPAYMSPEQARSEEVDGRSDLYSVGALMYECLSGLPPIRANNPHAMLVQIQDGIPDPLDALRPELHADLIATVERALEKRKEDRFDSAEQMLEALRPLLPFAPSSHVSDYPTRPPDEDLIARYARTTIKDIP